MNYNQFKQWLLDNKIKFDERNPYDSEEINKDEQAEELKKYACLIKMKFILFSILNKGGNREWFVLNYTDNIYTKKIEYRCEISMAQFTTPKITLFQKLVLKFLNSDKPMEQIIKTYQEYDKNLERLSKIKKQIEKMQKEKEVLEEFLKNYNEEDKEEEVKSELQSIPNDLNERK